MKEMQQSMEERLEQLSKFDELAQSTTKALDGAAEQMEFAKQLSGLTEKQQHLYKVSRRRGMPTINAPLDETHLFF